MEKSIKEQYEESFHVKPVQPIEYSSLSLAYIGDCIYDVLIKTMVVSQCNRQVNEYHQIVSEYVKAKAQSELIDFMMPKMTQEEIDIYKRGRNAKSYTKAKNATVNDYRRATGFEALIGYLYLEGNMKRIIELVSFGLEEEKHEREKEQEGI